MTKAPYYVVEFAGFNDGHPYEHLRADNPVEAETMFKEAREGNPRVPWRLIKVLSDWEKASG